MKKYWALFSVTVVALLAVFAGGNYFKGQIVKVTTTTLAPIDVQETINCSGKVETATKKNIYVPVPSITEEVYVEVGDWVEAGETLLCVSGQVSDSETAVPNLPDLDYSEIDSLEEAQQVYNDLLASGALTQNNVSSSQQPTSDGTLTAITAPINGVITAINVEPNDTAQEMEPVMVISNGQALQVTLSVNESQISALEVGQKAMITGSGFQGSTYTGTVKQIADVATQSVNTSGQETVVRVVVAVDDPGEDIKPGFTAKCKIVTDNDTGLLVAPYESVRADSDGAEYVYVEQEGRAVKTYITTGREFEQGFEITQGLDAGAKIILSPDSVWDGAHVLNQGTVEQESAVQSDV